MKFKFFLTILVFLWSCLNIYTQAPVNPNNSKKARHVLKFLNCIKGKAVLSGQENLATDVTKWTDIVKDITGEYPAILGEDWSYGEDAYVKRQNIVAAATDYWQKGGLVSISWHQVNPDTWDGSKDEGPFDDTQVKMEQERFDELLDEISDLHKKYLSHLDTIAGYLSMLQDSGVVVLWRPYHEMNGGWFWWGGKNNFAELWKIMFDRYTNYHELNNLIWVWSPNITNGKQERRLSDYFPGDNYVDIIGIDGYNNRRNWDENNKDKSDLNNIISMSGENPIAITELGDLPDPDWLQYQRPQIVWFLCWWTHIEDNGEAYINQVYKHPYVLNRSDLPGFSDNNTVHLKIKDKVYDALDKASQHYKNAIDQYSSTKAYPSHTDQQGNLKTVEAQSWVSGFFPGCLWYLYDYTMDEEIKEAAKEWTKGLENQQYNDKTHDLGFMMFCSFGNGYRLTGNPDYKDILLQTAETLGSRYNNNVGCIRSWDWGKWKFPVIIDNMMNLELMTWAGKESGNTHLTEIAVNHAKTTLQNHFRDDFSTYHVVDYNPSNGQVIGKGTFQGYSDESTWARGQAWGLYGYTMMFRETGDSIFLEQAIEISDFFLANLPADFVPYWDFDAPNIPDEPKDASAAAITASALLELYRFLPENEPYYLFLVEKILENLISDEYSATPGTNANFILKHSVGNKNSDSGVDVPQIYADYYFIEALIRYSRIGAQIQNPIENLVINEDGNSHIVVEDLYEVFGVSSDDDVKFEIITGSAGIQAIINNHNQLSVTPKPDFSGTVNVSVRAIMEEIIIQDDFFVTVTPSNDTPQKPVLVSPENKAILETLKLTFSWNPAEDIDRDTILYTFHLYNENIDTIIDNVSKARLRFDAREILENNATYNWQVIASDGQEEVESDIFSFTVPSGLSVSQQVYKPAFISVIPNYDTSTIKFSFHIHKTSKVNIRIINISGQQVYSFASDNFLTGIFNHLVRINQFTNHCENILLYEIVFEDIDGNIYRSTDKLLFTN